MPGVGVVAVDDVVAIEPIFVLFEDGCEGEPNGTLDGDNGDALLPKVGSTPLACCIRQWILNQLERLP